MDKLTPDALRARLRAAIGEPEITDHGFDLASARARRRRWWDLGLGTAPAAVRAAAMVGLVTAVVAVVTLGTLINLRVLPKPAGSSSGPAGLSQPTPSPSTLPSPAPVPLGPAVEGFVPSDVTAVSASQWWVLGSDGAGCSGAACTRILHTLDGGKTFTSIPTPSAAFTGLRFRDPGDGWAYSSTTVWSTHDGGAEWSGTDFVGTVEDLEASGGYVYAVVCPSGPGCTLERSPTNRDGWQALPIAGDLPPSGYVAAGSGYLAGSLNVHGSDVWMVFRWVSANGDVHPSVLVRSTDNGEQFTETSICPDTFGVTSLYAVNAEDLWATCVTGMLVDVWGSVDAGAVFTAVPGSAPAAMSATIAGTSPTNFVVASTALVLSSDAGRTFQTVEDNGGGWSIVGFTTSEDGFAFSLPAPTGLWRTDDGGATWYQVQFP
jgi:hypothetical protein